MKQLNLAFYVIKAKQKKGGYAPIYVRINLEGTQTTFSTGFSTDSKKWTSQNQLKLARNPEDVILREKLKDIKIKLNEKLKLMIEIGLVINAKNLKDAYLGKTSLTETNSKSWLEAFDYHNDLFKEKVKIGERSDGSLVKYNTTRKHLAEFINVKYGVDDILLKNLKYEVLERFELFLKNEKKIGHNTAIKYIQAARKIINIAVHKYYWLDKDPFSQFEGKLKETETVYLDECELTRLENKLFESERLNIVRDLFIFTCYTSYSHCDIDNLTKENIVKHFDGQFWIMTNRQKTDIESNVMILPQALAIIEKYKNHPLCVLKGSLLPIKSNQKVNEYLKEIATLCGINKNLHHYVARHTFATTVMLANGVPMETVSKMMGHKRITQTQHYAKLINRKVSDDLLALKRKLEEKLKRKNDKNDTDDKSSEIAC
ncbi:MAG: site-specific integrase [Burkholderiales bacterium]|nr:site-specific integrase [Bacteroidia bacterium]